MSSTMLKKADSQSIEKRFRMVLDFKVTIAEITEEDVREYYELCEDDEEITRGAHIWESAKRQNRLLQALIKDREALDNFLAYLLTDEVDPYEQGELKRIFQLDTEKEILAPIISTLPKKDARYFEALQDEDQFWENAEMLGERFVIQWVGASLRETRVVREGLVE